MRARDVIVIARRRASLTQQQLAQRLGVPQGTVGRWESGATEPKFDAVQKAVSACGFDLTLGFANKDEGSWSSLIYEQLARTPAERLRKLSRGSFDRLATLKLLGDAEVHAILVGETAGALHGWPLTLSDRGGLELFVRSNDLQCVKETVAALPIDPQRIHPLDALPGTSGYADLARNAVQIDLDGVTVKVAALIDLLRIALSEPGGIGIEFALALDSTLQLTEWLRSREAAGPIRQRTKQQAREAADEWLTRQTAA